MQRLTLLQYPGGDGLPSLSPPCLKVQLALRLMGLPFDVENARSPFEVSRRSPTGRVPALRIGERWIAESVTILDLLGEEFPDASIAPSDPSVRAHDRLWDCFATDTLYWLGVYQRWLVPRQRRRMLHATFGRRTALRLVAGAIMGPMLRRRARAQGIGGLSEAQARAAFVRALATAEDGIGAGPFLQARDRPGRGDAALAAIMVQTGHGDAMPEVFAEVRRRPQLVAHVRATFDAAGLPVPPWWPA